MTLLVLVSLVVCSSSLAARWPQLIDRLGQCETGHDYRFHNGSYEGFVAWYAGTWDLDKPRGYPDHAYQASPAQQRRVARISVYVRHRYFGCLHGPEHAWVRG